MEKTNCPIYHQVSEDLAIFPLAMRRSSHGTFMVQHRQDEWLAGALLRMEQWQPPTRVAERPRPRPRKRAARKRS